MSLSLSRRDRGRRGNTKLYMTTRPASSLRPLGTRQPPQAHAVAGSTQLFMMTIRAAKFTPEVLLSAPRRSPGSPNSTGKLVLHTVSPPMSPRAMHRQPYKGPAGPRRGCADRQPQVSTYSFQDHKKDVQIQLLDLESGHSTRLYKDAAYSEPTWVGETEFLFLKAGDKGSSALMLADAKRPEP